MKYLKQIILQISEVLVFMALLIIFILSYGIPAQALLNPPAGTNFQNTTFLSFAQNTILNPYWQMYGELLLENIEGMKGS